MTQRKKPAPRERNELLGVLLGGNHPEATTSALVSQATELARAAEITSRDHNALATALPGALGYQERTLAAHFGHRARSFMAEARV